MTTKLPVTVLQIPWAASQPVGLRELTFSLLENVYEVAAFNKSCFINEVQPVAVLTDKKLLSVVLEDFLYSVSAHVQLSRIRLTTRVYGNIVLMQVKDVAGNLTAIENRLRKLEPVISKLSGALHSWRDTTDKFTLTFAFANLPVLD